MKTEVKQTSSEEIFKKYGLGGNPKILYPKKPEEHKETGVIVKGSNEKNWWMTGK